MIEGLPTPEIAGNLLYIQKKPPIITPRNLDLDGKTLLPWLRQTAVRNATDPNTPMNLARLSWEGYLAGLQGENLSEGIESLNEIGEIALKGIMRYPYKFRIAMEELLVTGDLPEGDPRATQAALLLDSVLSSTMARIRACAGAKLHTLGHKANPTAQNLREQLMMVNRFGRGRVMIEGEGQKEELTIPKIYIPGLNTILDESPWVGYAESRPKEGVLTDKTRFIAALPMAGYPGMRLFASANRQYMPSLYELYSSQYD